MTVHIESTHLMATAGADCRLSDALGGTISIGRYDADAGAEEHYSAIEQAALNFVAQITRVQQSLGLDWFRCYPTVRLSKRKMFLKYPIDANPIRCAKNRCA